MKKTRSALQSAVLSYPRKIQCNVCGWEGCRFLSDSWHKHIICPACRSEIRHRLFIAALENLEPLSFDCIIRGKSVLHFAPEGRVSLILRERSATYVTADYLRADCDLRLDISNMPEVRDGSFDAVIAFDVLEHVADFKMALAELNRILPVGGFAVLTVPQKDGLAATYEDPGIVTPEERKRIFGQYNHLRIFGDDFPGIVEGKGFSVAAVNEASFPGALQEKHVLFPPVPSRHPLATNHRKVFFCRKLS